MRKYRTWTLSARLDYEADYMLRRKSEWGKFARELKFIARGHRQNGN